MNQFKFKFRYSSKHCKASGDGKVEACDIYEATNAAREGVASDFGGVVGSVQITSISKVKAKGKKHDTTN